MKARISLIHGWGYDAGLWREVLPLLADFETVCVDLGFFGAPTVIGSNEAPHLVVGHSLGLLWWLTQGGLPWARLVAINAFPRFVAGADFAAGVPARVLARMQKRFEQTPAQVLGEFQARCGRPGPVLPADPLPLAIGLQWLAERDGRTCLRGRERDVWALAADADGIVPAALTEASFGALPQGRLRWAKADSHVLPLTHPALCAELIREAAA